ncbi:hypothetical protein WJX73_004892 [Symbiochloris irregularis]|uniref:Plastid lipid-associated protein/fibrillin conserved domain-containing protein n=1 Tax=Symbiochloris irregularis TaxID=706552 RepID=A0AAW1PU65_9CHLO
MRTQSVYKSTRSSVSKEEQATTSASGRRQAWTTVKQAARTREVPREEVLAALEQLERAASGSEGPKETAGTLQDLAGSWRLVFSAPGAIKQWEYIPVAEDVIYNTDSNTIALASDLGPLRTVFKGSFSWDASKRSMQFGFSQVELTLFGRTFTRDLGGSQKTYDFFAIGETCACARSSRGPLTLLARV